VLRTDLLDVLNSGSAWAFIGGGVSVDSGYPSWQQLVEGTIARMGDEDQRTIMTDKRYQEAFRRGEYDRCFSLIEKVVGRGQMESAVRSQLDEKKTIGQMAATVSQWPFAGYVTSNYDTLLESGLNSIGEGGWVPVGNAGGEIAKVSGGARGIVWHCHGSIDMPSERSHLILTTKDYDDIYLDDCPLERQLRAVLSQHRFVFIGFGFNDPELRRLLRITARYTIPTRPILAFLADPGSGDDDWSLELLERHNVDVIPYQIISGSHHRLTELLDAYNALVLRRSLQFGKPRTMAPSYDPTTTGLLIYNQLALGTNTQIATEAVDAIIRARILSLLQHTGPCTLAGLAEDMLERIRLLRTAATDSEGAAAANAAISKAVVALENEGLVERVEGGLGTAVQLLPRGKTLIETHIAANALMGEQFTSSLATRTRAVAAGLGSARQANVVSVAEEFLKECVSKRALGVAMAWESPRTDFRSYHLVALLQALPEHLARLADAQEGKALLDVVRAILASPNEIERQYLGCLLQAQFGLCLTGFDPETLSARTQDLQSTLFLLDSTTLIPLLGRSSLGHEGASHLLEQLRTIGARVATTDLLGVEVAEHARWALNQLGGEKTLATVEALAAATGRAGRGDNVFIEGCIAEATVGKTPDIGRYLDSITGSRRGHDASDQVFQQALRQKDISCLAFNEWQGYSAGLMTERETLQREIGERRRANHTFRHERQVQAEAEAVLIVRHVREGALGIDGAAFTDAHFLSHSRVIDDVVLPTRPITMRPEAAQQWLSTAAACPPEQLGLIVDCLLWELSERRMSIVDTQRVRLVFSPLLDASKAVLGEEVARHRDLIAERYGEDSVKAFAEVDPLDAPFVARSYFVGRSEELENALETQREVLEHVRKTATLTTKEREELERLRSVQRQKALETRQKRRKLAGSRNRRRRGRKH
jgi:hypothetical protein